MATVAKLNVQIGATIKGLEGSLKKAESGLNNFAKNATAIGGTLSKSLTLPLVGFATASVFAFDKQAKAVAQVEQAILSTGGAANRTSKELQDMASSLQKNSLFGDEEILQKVTAQLLTFTNISGTAFDRTQQAALDLASRLGGDLQSASIQLGKALNDPVANLSALSRSGIQFSTDQKELIDSLVETNRLADAQTIILDELERQYGGSAKAAADAGSGGITQLKNSFGDLMEQIGEVVVEAINPFVKRLKEIVEQLQQTDKETLKFYITLGAIAAAIGPVLIGLGLMAKGLVAVKTVAFVLSKLLVKSLVFAFGLLAKAVTFVLSPIFLKIAAIAALGVAINTLIHNLKPLGERFMYYFGIAKNAVIEMAASALNALGELVSYANATAGGALKGLAESMRSLKGEIEDPANMTPFVGPLEALGDTFSILKDKVLGYVDSLSKASTEIDTLSEKSKDVTAPTFAFSGASIESADMVTAPTFAFSGGGIESADMGTEGELKVRTVDTETYANAVGYLGSRLNEVAVNTSAINMQTEQMSVGFELLKPLSDEFVNSFAQGMANVVMQGEKLQDMLKNIGKMLLSSAIQTGIKLLLSGGLSSAGKGFFGSGGGLFGKIFGGATPVNDALIQSNGNIVKFHPDDNILAMKDFSNLGSGGGGVVKVQMVASPVRITNKEIVFAFTQGQTDWSR